jgi:CPA2 family monovalent cation:H+ antiporter-2
MHTETFLQDLAVVLAIAGLVTIVFHRFKQPVVLGYIIAGVIIGPHTPPFPLIHDKEAIDTLAELGVILLMFSIGLEFSLHKLRQVGGPALIAAFLEILLMLWIGYQIGRLFSWSPMDSIFLGAMLSISSTTIIAKSLGDLGKTKERFAQLIFGILIIEDILAIVMIVLLSGIAMTGTLRLGSVAVAIGKLGIFLAAALVAGLIAVPRLIGYVAKFKSNEMLLVTVLGLCFAFSLLAAKLGYSVALGAFIIGAIIAESREIHRIEDLTEPVRDMFSAVFFVAIGLLIDPKLIAQHWLPVTVITIAVVIGQSLTCAFGTFIAGNDTRTSLRVGLGLAQIGEFSFIIAALGVSLKVTSDFLYPIAVAVSAVTTLLNPYLIKNADRFVGWFDRLAPPKLVNYLALYTRWVGQLGTARPASLASKLARRWSLQMALNALLMAAVFAGAALLSRHPPGWLEQLRFGAEAIKAVLWLSAAILSLPLFIAIFRKLQAFGLLIAETRISRASAGERTAALRQVLAQSIVIAGVVILILFVLVLSSTLLPSFRVLLVLLAIVALVAFMLWRSFIRIYSQAQIALRETLSQPPPARPLQAPPQLTGLLREADLRVIELRPDSPAVGKLIRELELRTRTGASIVGIERQSGARLINPGPDEDLQPGDQLLLLGTPAQLDAAKLALSNSDKLSGGV